MMLDQKNKIYFLNILLAIAIILLIVFVGEILFPFIFALFIAYLLNPVIVKIQKKLKNRALAVTSFLLLCTLFFGGIIFFFGSHAVNDTKRLVHAGNTFVQLNKAKIEAIETNLKKLGNDFYTNEAVKKLTDNLNVSNTSAESPTDWSSYIGSIASFFEGSSEDTTVTNIKSWNKLSMLINTIIYVICILYTYAYFEKKQSKYLSNQKPINKKVQAVWNEFKTVFVVYFKQRKKVVLLNSIIFMVAFNLLGIPGAIVLAILSGLLSYAAHFHYLSLPLALISIWVVSIENESSFIVYLSITLAVYIIVSIFEETIYFNKIMNSVKGMNSAIMVFAFTLWIYIFGAFIGTVVALPLTQLILIYLDEIIINYKKQLE